MSINNEELKTLCIAGEMTNGQMADHFEVDVTEIYAWRSRHGLTINKCKEIREGKASTGKRTAVDIEAEIRKVERAQRDAMRKAIKAQNRLDELHKELKEAKK
jgi:hypothetical protein